LACVLPYRIAGHRPLQAFIEPASVAHHSAHLHDGNRLLFTNGKQRALHAENGTLHASVKKKRYFQIFFKVIKTA
jgi:hypothetical protein